MWVRCTEVWIGGAEVRVVMRGCKVEMLSGRAYTGVVAGRGVPWHARWRGTRVTQARVRVGVPC
jgi:hypothetical protein